ncbi:MAG: sigma-54 interaction domain-containing protein [Candidatus Binatia bacterium]
MAESFLNPQSFHLILDAVQDGVAVYDRNGILVWVNDKSCQISGLSRTEIIGRKLSEILVAFPESIATRELVEQPPTPASMQYKHIQDFTSPGYAVFRNGRRLFYMPTLVHDEYGDLLYLVVTLQDVTDLSEARKQIAELQQLTTFYQDQLRTFHARVLGREIVYRSEVMRKLLERALRLAQLDRTILITGETGVGKNMLAQYLHVVSRRAQGPFIHINCASLPESLVEAELFGHTEGAFTGATRKGKKGLIELGHKGTVFLDEISEMSIPMQAKLLSVLEDKTVRRVGSERWITVDVRFVAATNKDPETQLRHKSLREDLYHRLAEHSIHLPPLRERPEDIPSLVEQTLAEFNEQNGTTISFQPDVVRHLQELPLPGNVRELRNLVWQIAAEAGEETEALSCHMLPPDLTKVLAQRSVFPAQLSPVLPVKEQATEEQQLRDLCEHYQGDVYAMARALGVHRTTVIRKLKSYGVTYTSSVRIRLA